MSRKWIRGVCATIKNLLKENYLINCINKCQVSQITYKFSNLTSRNNVIGLPSKLKAPITSIKEPWFMHCPTESIHVHSTKVKQRKRITKISIIGSNDEGIKISAYILNSNLCRQLVIMNPSESHANGRISDTAKFENKVGTPTVVNTTGDALGTRNSDFVIVTAGTKQGNGVSYLETAQKNAELLQQIMPEVANVNPDAVFIITSNPSNLMAWMVQKKCDISPVRCISAGCHLDTARFRYLIAKRLDISPKKVQGYIIGAQGEYSVPVWSSVNVNGVPLSNYFPDLIENNYHPVWKIVHNNVIQAASDDQLCSNTNPSSWAMSAAIVDIIRGIDNGQSILTVGTDVLGYCSVKQHVILSLPCKMNLNGITHIANLQLTELESELLQRSAHKQWGRQCYLNI